MTSVASAETLPEVLQDSGGGSSSASRTCISCGHPLAERGGYRLGGALRCLGCTLRFPPLVRRSGLTALVVGTILVGINQGPELLAGQFAPALTWKVPLTYLVPFCVATWGALVNSRS